MEWKQFDSADLLDELVIKSHTSPQIIFKHSTRCSISFMVLNRFEANLPNTDYFILDVIGQRAVSNSVAQHFDIAHQSPQLLIIFKGSCIFNTSHFNISSEVVEREINALQLA